MKQILFFLFLILPALAFAQWPAAPNKIRLGNQTTGDGLIYRSDSLPDYTPSSRNNAWLHFDTVAKKLYFYEGGTWQEYTNTYANGLTLASDTVKLGGALTANTTISGDFQLIRTGGINSQPIVSSTNTASNGIAVQGTASAGTGLRGISTNGYGVIGESNSFPLTAISTSTSNTVVKGLELFRGGTFTGTPNNGTKITYGAKRRSGNVEAVETIAMLVDTSDYLKSDFTISVRDSVLTQKLKLASTGQLTLDAYGSGTFTGTATKYLAVTSAGAVIEVDTVGAGGGELSDAYISSDTLYLITPDSTYTILIPAGADDWGTQVVEKDSTLRGNGTLADPLRVNRDTFPTRAEVAQALADSVTARPTGTGTTNALAKWLSSTSLGNSLLTDDGSRITAGGTAGLVLPVGTTAQRSGAPLQGETRASSSTGLLETYNGSAWKDVQFAGFQNSLVPYATSNGQLTADTSVYRSGAELHFRRGGLSGTVPVLVIGRSGGTFPTFDVTGISRFVINYEGTTGYSFRWAAGKKLNFLSNTVQNPSGTRFVFTGGWGSSNTHNRPGYNVDELNSQGTRIYAHRFAETTFSQTTGNISPFIIAMPSRFINSWGYYANNSIITGTIFRQQIIADSSAGSPVRLLAIDISPTYNSNSFQAFAHGVRYNPQGTIPALHYAFTTTSGRVGFGTETPTDTLHVVGTARVTGSSTLPAASVTGRDSMGVFRDVTIGSGLSLSGGTLSATGPAAKKAITLYSITQTRDSVDSTPVHVQLTNVPASQGSWTYTDSTVTLTSGIYKVSFCTETKLTPQGVTPVGLYQLSVYTGETPRAWLSMTTIFDDDVNARFHLSATGLLNIEGTQTLSLRQTVSGATIDAQAYHELISLTIQEL